MINSALDLLDKLVAFPSVSHTSNKDITDYIETYLAGYGVSCLRTVTPDGAKHNLIATIGDPNTPGIVLSGHTDVVPVEGQNWSRDPFKLHVENGKAFGRGAVDMKGFLACVLAHVPKWVAAERAVPIHLTFTHDEEIGCLGAQAAVDALLNSVTQPKAAIIGEPTRHQPLSRHKGCTGLVTEFTGLSCHSSRPQAGVNAVYTGARFVSWLERVQSDLAGEDDAALSHFDTAYSTLNVGTIHGGSGRNLVPQGCQIEWEIREARAGDLNRILAEADDFIAQGIDPLLQGSASEGGVSTEVIFDVKGFFGHSGPGAVTLVQNLTGNNNVFAADFATEAGFFDVAGIPSVVCGPGDAAQAHTQDEWIELSELQKCLSMLGKL